MTPEQAAELIEIGHKTLILQGDIYGQAVSSWIMQLSIWIAIMAVWLKLPWK